MSYMTEFYRECNEIAVMLQSRCTPNMAKAIQPIIDNPLERGSCKHVFQCVDKVCDHRNVADYYAYRITEAWATDSESSLICAKRYIDSLS